ncbi:hypothetical protein CAPTEDRAFT_207339 [Capitella teleta]|uniref:Secreted protein n=1 Tax=Capitella teleta TaxID=283909 RepID=R7T696_CAPTE|nr:hypothetical protein CAPTEDRAFT_207339 [Capitella teleta]|eukprot:ELT89064.1 hypothetical protein CAPTEDRAFT_207339 [Capitella teleta]
MALHHLLLLPLWCRLVLSISASAFEPHEQLGYGSTFSCVLTLIVRLYKPLMRTPFQSLKGAIRMLRKQNGVDLSTRHTACVEGCEIGVSIHDGFVLILLIEVTLLPL